MFFSACMQLRLAMLSSQMVPMEQVQGVEGHPAVVLCVSMRVFQCM